MRYDDKELLLGVRTDSELRGVIPSSFDHVFKHIARSHDKVWQTFSRYFIDVNVLLTQQFLVRASYLEIYQVHCLLKLINY